MEGAIGTSSELNGTMGLALGFTAARAPNQLKAVTDSWFSPPHPLQTKGAA